MRRREECGGGIEENGKLDVGDFIKFKTTVIKNENNNSLSMGASAHHQPQEQYNKMPEGILPKILRTPRWKMPLPNEPYLFFGTIVGVQTYYYRYVVYNTFGGSPKFKELLYSPNHSGIYYVSPNPIDRSEIDNKDLKELKSFLQSERTKNNGNASFCTRIFESLSDISSNS